MPDIFMPNDTSGISSYYITVANAGLFQKFAFDYVDVNRSVFARAKDLNTLLDMLPDDESLLREFVGYCVDNGVPARWYYINISRDLIVNQVKALIARDVLDYNAYFTVSNRIDPSVRRALEEFKKGTADFPLSLKPRQPKPPMK